MVVVILFITLAVFLSAVIRQVSGFGFALVSMPLITLLVGIRVATPFVAIAATTGARSRRPHSSGVAPFPPRPRESARPRDPWSVIGRADTAG